jgi:hypothetical protein
VEVGGWAVVFVLKEIKKKKKPLLVQDHFYLPKRPTFARGSIAFV